MSMAKQDNYKFLSTPSARRATWTSLEDIEDFSKFLSTPSARRATWMTAQSERYARISIHALREEGDSLSFASSNVSFDFYPRPPRGGRLHAPGEQHIDRIISIHALREEGDCPF